MSVKHVNGADLYYDEYGSGDRYIFSGMMCHSRISEWTIDLSKHGFHVINVTIRGYGKSSHVTEDLGNKWYDVWADDICALADELGVKRFIYTGWSHGAAIGWTIARRHPERVTALLTIAGGPHKKDGQQTGEARRQTIEAAYDEELWEKRALQMAELDYPDLPHPTPETEAIRKACFEEDYELLKNMTVEERVIDPRKPFPLIDTEEKLISELSEIDIPVLMIGGALDPISTPDVMIRTCNAIKGSKLIIYQDCSHPVANMRQAEVVKDMLQFCRDRDLI